MVPTDEIADEGDTRARFKNRVRQWREEAILQAVSDLLLSRGCQGLTMDDLARKVGIAKGSLYLHTATRDGLVAQALDRWAQDVPAVPSDEGADQEKLLAAVCDALFHAADRGASAETPAIPCCLMSAPCPYGWTERWERIAEERGIRPSDDVRMLGEAIQAIASMPTTRALLESGQLGLARQLITRLVAGYLVRGPSG